MLEEGVLIKYRNYTKVRKTGRQADNSARVSQGEDLGPETRSVVSIMEVELARQEAFLPLDLALVKPKQEYCLVLGLGMALLLPSRFVSLC